MKEQTVVELPWHAEHRVTADEAARLGRAAFGLAARQCRRLGEGWDFENFLLDGSHVLRLPKRSECAAALLREREILERLCRLDLPAAVPRFDDVSAPRDGFPWHFALCGLMPGAPLSARADAEAARVAAPSVGTFLAALHDADLPAMASPWMVTGSEMDELGRQFERSIGCYSADLRGFVNEFLTEPAPARPVVPIVFAHADLMPDHMFVSTSGSLCGVIDWADAHTTERCVDFAGLYYAGGREAAASAYRAYGVEPDAREWAWLEHAAVAIGIEDVFYGCQDAQPQRVAAALARLSWLSA